MSNAQAMQALALANATRRRQAEVKRELAALPYVESLQAMVALLDDTEDAVQRMELGRAVEAVCRIGRRRARSLLSEAAVTPTRWRAPLGKLTDNERTRITNVLQAAAARHRQHPTGSGSTVVGAS